MLSLPFDIVERWGLSVTPDQVERMTAFGQALLLANRSQSLTSITDPEQIAVQHFLDSLSCLLLIRVESGSLVDVGSGAGFPGMVLAIVRPKLSVVLIESNSNKAAFLREVAESCCLTNVAVCNQRAETAGHDTVLREKFDFATCRAVGTMSEVAEYCLPLLKLGGILVAARGHLGETEAAEAHDAIALLGGQVKEACSVSLPGLRKVRVLVAVEKVAPTPPRFPRRVGVPKKKPL